MNPISSYALENNRITNDHTNSKKPPLPKERKLFSSQSNRNIATGTKYGKFGTRSNSHQLLTNESSNASNT